MLQENNKTVQNFLALNLKYFSFPIFLQSTLKALILSNIFTSKFKSTLPKPFLKFKQWCNRFSQSIMCLENDIPNLCTYKLNPYSKHGIIIMDTYLFKTFQSLQIINRLSFAFLSASVFVFDKYFLMIFIGSVGTFHIFLV